MAKQITEIRVTEGYRGRKTKEQYIEPDDYQADDPRLHGLAEFLVSTGRAKILREEEVPPHRGVITDADPAAFLRTGAGAEDETPEDETLEEEEQPETASDDGVAFSELPGSQPPAEPPVVPVALPIKPPSKKTGSTGGTKK